MKDVLGFVRTTLAGGFFVLLPLVVLAIVFGDLFRFIDSLMEPLAAALPVESVGGVEIAFLLSVVACLLICFLAGAVLNTQLGARVNGFIERAVFSRIPGYQLVRSLTDRFSTQAEGVVVLARLAGAGAWSVGLLVEELDDGSAVVFVPIAPTPTVGSVVVVAPEDFRVLEASAAAAMNSVMQWGVGTRNLVAE